MSRNLRNAAVAFGQQVLGAVSGAIGMFFIARQMPNAPIHWGHLTFALAFVGFFLAVQRLVDDAHVKRVSEGKPLGACNSTYLLLNLGATAGLVVLALGGAYLWEVVLPALRPHVAFLARHNAGGFQDPITIRVIELIVTYQVLNSIGEYVRRTYEGQQNILMGQVILSSEHVVKGAAMVYVAFNGLSPFIEGTRNALGIAGAFVVGAAALAVVAILLMIGQPFGKPSWPLAKSYLSFGWKTSLTVSLFSVAVNAAAVIVQLFWGPAEVGFYGAPARYVQFLPAAATAVTTAIFPVFSSLHAQGRTDPDLVQRMVWLVSLILIPVVALSVAMPEAIIHVLLSDKFLPSAPVLIVLSIGGYVQALRATVGSKLGGINRPGEVTKAAGISMVATLVFGVVLVAPSFLGVPLFGLGAVGAALALTLSQFAGFGQVLRAARKHAGVTFPPIWRHAIIFAGTAATLWGVTLILPELSFRFYHLIGAAVVALAATVVFGVLTREISREDLRAAWRILHPSEWAGFVREEAGRGRAGRRGELGFEPDDVGPVEEQRDEDEGDQDDETSEPDEGGHEHEDRRDQDGSP